MRALTRLRHAATLVATTVAVAKRRLGGLRERVARKDDVGKRWDEGRLIAVEVQAPIRGWRILLLLGFDPFERAFDFRLRLFPLQGGLFRLRFHFPIARPAHAV